MYQSERMDEIVRILKKYLEKYIDALKREGCSYHKSNNVKDIGGRR